MTDNQQTDEMRVAFPARRLADESHIAFVAMLAFGANNLCTEQLWKDLCNEAGRRLHRAARYEAALREAREALQTCRLFAGCEREYDEQAVTDAIATIDKLLGGK